MCLHVIGAWKHPSLMFSAPGRPSIERGLIKWSPAGVPLLRAGHLGWPTKNKTEANKIKENTEEARGRNKLSVHSFVIAVLQASALVRSSKVALG